MKKNHSPNCGSPRRFALPKGADSKGGAKRPAEPPQQRKKLKNQLIWISVMILAVVAVVEFQKFMKRRSEKCIDGSCKLPAGHGLVINPFPMETVPAQAVQEKPLPMLIEFGAGKCANCKMMNGILEELSIEYADQLRIRFIDVWENEEAGKKYSIRMIPTQVFLDATGNELFRHEGFISKDDILKKWAELGVEL
jgi:thioredoxin 1